MATAELTIDGPFRLYIFGKDGYHTGGLWFDAKLQYPDEQITTQAAKFLSDEAVADGREVRITDGGDCLLYHAMDGKQLFPPPPIDFWAEIGVED